MILIADFIKSIGLEKCIESIYAVAKKEYQNNN
jgi:hypothetical protein